MADMKKYLSLFVLFIALSASGQITYTWNQAGSADWTDPSNWMPARNVPASDDILVFDNAAVTTAINIVPESIGQLRVINNTTLNLQAGAASITLSLTGATGTDLIVAAGAALNISGTHVMTLFLQTGADAAITGTMSFSGAPHRMDAAGAGSIVFYSPSVFTQGISCTGNVFTTAGTPNAVVFTSGTVFVQNAGANPFGLAQPSSKVVFQPGSLFKMQHNALPGLSGRTYADFEINSPSFNQTSSGVNPLTMDNLTVTTGSFTINLTGGVNIRGNISVLPGGTLRFNPTSTNPLRLNGTATQYISNSGSLLIDGQTNFILSNPANVVLNTSVELGNLTQLSLISGKLLAGDYNFSILNSSTGAVSGYSPASYVVTNGSGAFCRNISGAGMYIFPVGSESALQEASVAFAVPLAGLHTLSARFIASHGGNMGLPLAESGDNITHTSIGGHWEMLVNVPVPEPYTGTFIANAFGDIINYSRLHLLKRADAGSPWVLDGMHVPTSGTNSLAVLQRTGMTGFSQFAVGGEQTVSLPVFIRSFSGFKDGPRNQLRWTTVTELNNRGFEVQRSTDGMNFSSIGFISSSALGGNSSDQLQYSFTDNAPAGSKQYYRLRQEDFDGQDCFSTIVLIRNSKPQALSIQSLFPNPARNYVNLQVDAPSGKRITIIVTDMAGRNVLQRVRSVGEGSNTITLDISSLARGHYAVRVLGGEGSLLFSRQ